MDAACALRPTGVALAVASTMHGALRRATASVIHSARRHSCHLGCNVICIAELPFDSRTAVCSTGIVLVGETHLLPKDFSSHGPADHVLQRMPVQADSPQPLHGRRHAGSRPLAA